MGRVSHIGNDIWRQKVSIFLNKMLRVISYFSSEMFDGEIMFSHGQNLGLFEVSFKFIHETGFTCVGKFRFFVQEGK